MQDDARGEAANRRQKAQAMVEFALAIPIVMILMMGIIELGRLLFTYTSVAAAGREAARYGSGVGANGTTPMYNDCVGIRAAAKRIGRFAGVQDWNVLISHDAGPGTTANAYCGPDKVSDNQAFAANDRILVQINSPYTPISPLVYIPPFTLVSQNAHSIVKEAQVISAVHLNNPADGQVCSSDFYSHLFVPSVSMPSGPDVTVAIENKYLVSHKITQLQIIWFNKNGQLLTSIDGVPGIPNTPMAQAGPVYTSVPLNWTIPPAPGVTVFNFHFSSDLKGNNVILQFTTDVPTVDGTGFCVFGK